MHNVIVLCHGVGLTEPTVFSLTRALNMLCTIYRSSKRDQTYLYIEKKDDFSRVPPELMASFGQPQLAMTLSLDGRKSLAAADIDHVRQALIEQGFYLQIPPPLENLLANHLGCYNQ